MRRRRDFAAPDDDVDDDGSESPTSHRASFRHQRQLSLAYGDDAVAVPTLRTAWREPYEIEQVPHFRQPSHAHYSPFSAAAQAPRSFGHPHLGEQRPPPADAYAVQSSVMPPPTQRYNTRRSESPVALLPPSAHLQHRHQPEERYFQLRHNEDSGDDADFAENRDNHFAGGHLLAESGRRETRAPQSSLQSPHISKKSTRETLSPLRLPHLHSHLSTGADSATNSTPIEAVASGSVEDETSSSIDKTRTKRARYLRDTDRRTIIQRIDSGEKQAALAREFGVTRAAICHIKKNRDEIISRYDQLVRSAREMESTMPPSEAYATTNFSHPSTAGEEDITVVVLEDRSRAVPILITTLRNVETLPVDYRRAACRLIMILLEEAIAGLGSQSARVTTVSGLEYLGLRQNHSLCGVAIDESGLSFLKLFTQMEPEAARGFVHVDLAVSSQQSRHAARSRTQNTETIEIDGVGEEMHQRWFVERTDLPPHIAECKVLLFSATSSDGERVRTAIEVLLSVRVPEHQICVVVLLLAADAVNTLCSRFPDVKIVTASIDSDVDPNTGEILPGLGDFVARYNSD